jgi:hypothetical protein
MVPTPRPLALISGLVLSVGLATTAAAQEEPAPIVHVTGTVIEAYTYDADEVISGGREGFAYDLRGYQVSGGSKGVIRHVVEWSDPRLPQDLWVASDATTIWSMSAGGGGHLAIAALLEDEHGRWEGTGRWVMSNEPTSFYALTGEGAYQGLHALLRGVAHEDPRAFFSGLGDLAYEGYIFEAELAPFPDVPEPVTTEAFREWPPPEE